MVIVIAVAMAEVGANDGPIVGVALGWTVGPLLGASVGSGVGDMVGLKVGKTVGLKLQYSESKVQNKKNKNNNNWMDSGWILKTKQTNVWITLMWAILLVPALGEAWELQWESSLALG